MKYLIFAILATLALPGCQGSRNTGNSVEQGIEGQIWWRQGNWMPGVAENGTPSARGMGEPVRREIYVCPMVKLSALEGEAPIYPELPVSPVAKVFSGTDGKFRLALPPGKYSLFVKEETGFFANMSDGAGFVQLAEVQDGKLTHVEIVVDYKAAY